MVLVAWRTVGRRAIHAAAAEQKEPLDRGLRGGSSEHIPRPLHIDFEDAALVTASDGGRMEDVGGTRRLQYLDTGLGITDIELYMLQMARIFCWHTSIRQIAGDDLANGWVMESATNQVPSDKAGCARDE
jgi:hypothetical protein